MEPPDIISGFLEDRERPGRCRKSPVSFIIFLKGQSESLITED